MAWIRVALALLLLALTATAEVVPLTDATFAETVNSDSLWFVDFYVDWCPWSQRLAPAWEQLGNDEELRQAGVEVGTVDCDNNKATCVKAKVLGYPSMKIFYKGEFLDEYTGARDSKCMKAFALGFQVGLTAVDAAIPVMSDSTVDVASPVMSDSTVDVSSPVMSDSTVDAAIPVMSDSTGELEEELLRDPLISVGTLPGMLLKFFGF